ncbi:hypothetical protein NONI108955_21170 [Nocardia ninae]|uniref:Uncharacterized protein n=1 Tax=Nocardia ninae NBRC 108245 TaxID=1210091 RepID=A0A511MCH4_9NOCA|nr:hypothetical protein NN4_19850 [Nocardia ninae NBRC 108245]
MIVSRGDGVTWLFHTGASCGRWAKWVGHAEDGIRVSSICYPTDGHPAFRWWDRSPTIGDPGQISFGLDSRRPALKYLRDEFGPEWTPLWDKIQQEYDENSEGLRAAQARGHR